MNNDFPAQFLTFSRQKTKMKELYSIIENHDTRLLRYKSWMAFLQQNSANFIA